MTSKVPETKYKNITNIHSIEKVAGEEWEIQDPDNQINPIGLKYS